jgi:hypothetical protein
MVMVGCGASDVPSIGVGTRSSPTPCCGVSTPSFTVISVGLASIEKTVGCGMVSVSGVVSAIAKTTHPPRIAAIEMIVKSVFIGFAPYFLVSV